MKDHYKGLLFKLLKPSNFFQALMAVSKLDCLCLSTLTCAEIARNNFWISFNSVKKKWFAYTTMHSKASLLRDLHSCWRAISKRHYWTKWSAVWCSLRKHLMFLIISISFEPKTYFYKSFTKGWMGILLT